MYQSIHSLFAAIRKDQLQDTINEVDHAIKEMSIGGLSNISVTWQKVKEETSSEPDLQYLLEVLEQDTMPKSRLELPESIREYHQLRDHLFTVDEVILYKDRPVIPKSPRSQVLSTLHSAHQGVQSMISRAQSSVFWPGITLDIKETRRKCNPCNRMAPSQPSRRL